MGRLYTKCIVALALACGVGFVSGCASSAGSIAVDDLTDEPGNTSVSNEYIIGVGDLISIQVWDQEKMSGRMRVRSDGRISLPFLNDVEAAGKAPVRLAGELEAGLKSVILNPQVTVTVEESRPLSISVLGEVTKPGVQMLDRGVTVAQALAAAGGLTNFAHKDRIFVLRPGPPPARIRFKYDALVGSIGKAPLFRLRAGDVVVVE